MPTLLTLNFCKLSAEEFAIFAICSLVHKVCPLIKFLVIEERDLKSVTQPVVTAKKAL